MIVPPNGVIGTNSQSAAVRNLVAIAAGSRAANSGTKRRKSKGSKKTKKRSKAPKTKPKKRKSAKVKALKAGSAAAKAWGKKMAKLRKKK